MGTTNIIDKPLSDLKPYAKNPRNNKDAIKYVMESIKEFGFKVPIVIDKYGVIVAGHTRYEASKMLGLESVPCIIADDLSEAQIKAFRLADNKVSEKAEWDFDLLGEEIDGLLDFDMELFGFEYVDEEEEKQKHEKNVEKTTGRILNILNLEYAQFEGVGAYDIPELKGIKKLPKIGDWIGFNYMMSDKSPEGKGVHFFMDDYQFERIWNDPEKYMNLLSNYDAVITPDFSPYGDMPEVLKIYQHYRKQWFGAYMEMNGISVIPNVRWVDDSSFSYCLDGIPKNSVIAISTVAWCKSPESIAEFKRGYARVYELLQPKKVIMYGKPIEGIEGDIVNVKSFIQSRWGE